MFIEAQFPRSEIHGECFARSLRVPNKPLSFLSAYNSFHNFIRSAQKDITRLNATIAKLAKKGEDIELIQDMRDEYAQHVETIKQVSGGTLRNDNIDAILEHIGAITYLQETITQQLTPTTTVTLAQKFKRLFSSGDTVFEPIPLPDAATPAAGN